MGGDIPIGGFIGDSAINNLPANARDARDMGSIPGSGRFPGEGNGNPLQYSCLENLMDREAWTATVHGATKSQIGLSAHTCISVGWVRHCEAKPLVSGEEEDQQHEAARHATGIVWFICRSLL